MTIEWNCQFFTTGLNEQRAFNRSTAIVSLERMRTNAVLQADTLGRRILIETIDECIERLTDPNLLR